MPRHNLTLAALLCATAAVPAQEWKPAKARS